MYESLKFLDEVAPLSRKLAAPEVSGVRMSKPLTATLTGHRPLLRYSGTTGSGYSSACRGRRGSS